MTDVLDPPPGELDRDEAGAAEPSAAAGASTRRTSASRLAALPPLTTLVGPLVAVVACVYVLVQLHPRLLLSDTTPAGGDMGAHVWGPAYLRDHLLPELRVTGWTPDWYAGFPAYHFYMVVPSLAIVAVNAGLHPVVGLPLAAAVLALTWRATATRPGLRPWALAAAVLVAVVLVAVPYGTAFKVVSVSGVVLMPLAGWAMARLFGAPEPIPALAPIATLFFLFDTNFSIYGGNIASTLAGEFAFSMSLALGLLALGLVAHGLDTGRHRAVAAVVLALVGLCHLIPVFYVVVASVLAVGLARAVNRGWWVLLGLSAALLPVGLAPGAASTVRYAAPLPFLVTAGFLLATSDAVRRRSGWLVTTGLAAVGLAAFWMVPFLLREPFMNDMGWERLEEVGEALLTTPMIVALPVAAVGFLLALAHRERLGVLLGVLVLATASATANVPDTRLWNARILPFFYLSVYLLAAVGVGLAVRAAAVALSERFDRPHPVALSLAPVAALAVGLVAVGMPLRNLPGGEVQADGSYTWLGLENTAGSFIPGWASWNYSGYEAKPAYREYHDIVTAMEVVGQERGCGRAMWEYAPDLDRYGTPMALMLLPFWTDGCIGSMEGLYFESSLTTPFHFLNQSVLSAEPSRAQRSLPYRDFEGGAILDVGVTQLQTMGVRYYLATSLDAIAAARADDELTEVASSGPWVVFEVAGSELVEPLPNLPVVVEGEAISNPVDGDRFRTGWLGEAVESFNRPESTPALLPADSGPEGWPRAVDLASAPEVPAGDAVVSDIRAGRSDIEFRVDRTGVPVLVKASYFPNWSVSGAEGPWRVGPNLMVVVPTANDVRLHYGTTGVEWLAWLLTVGGVAAVVALARRDRRPVPSG